MQLDWPAKAEAFTFMISVVRNVCECALFYVSEACNCLRPEDMHDGQGHFRATEKVCCIIMLIHGIGLWLDVECVYLYWPNWCYQVTDTSYQHSSCS